MSDEKLFWYFFDLVGKFDEPIRNVIKYRPVMNFFVILIMLSITTIIFIFVFSYVANYFLEDNYVGVFTAIHWLVIFIFSFIQWRVMSVCYQELRTYRSERDLKDVLLRRQKTNK